MNIYAITFYNKRSQEFRIDRVEKITFNEAVMDSNLTRGKIGFDWEVTSILKLSKSKEKEKNER